MMLLVKNCYKHSKQSYIFESCLIDTHTTSSFIYNIKESLSFGFCLFDCLINFIYPKEQTLSFTGNRDNYIDTLIL